MGTLLETENVASKNRAGSWKVTTDGEGRHTVDHHDLNLTPSSLGTRQDK